MTRQIATLAGAALAAACLSDAHADIIVIDPFDGPEQQAPPDSDVEAPSAIGGRRFMTSTGELTGIVSESEGHLDVFNFSELGGTLTVEWNGGGTLGGVDLTDGGSNEFIDIVTELVTLGALTETLMFSVMDSVGGESSVEIPWIELSAFSSNLIPFTSLEGDADLTSIDVISLATTIVVSDRQIQIDSISAVPIPAPATLPLVVVGGCLLGSRRCRRD
jgi:hypothetical protein